MFKRILQFAAAAAAAASLASCQNDSTPTIEFEKQFYVMSSSNTIEIKVIASDPSESDLVIPVTFSGTAVKDEDYSVDTESVTIPAGKTDAVLNITNINLDTEKTLSLAFSSIPDGYRAGARSQTVVSVDPQEIIVYSFDSKKGDAVGSYYLKINVTGAVSGNNLHLADDLEIPLKLSGSAAASISFDDGKAPHATIKPGKTFATARFTLNESFTSGDKVTISVDTDAEPRFTPGDNEQIELTLYKVEIPDALIGTWAFDHVFDEDDLKYFFAEEADDTSLLPLNNEGFTLTFSKNNSGEVILTSNKTGDFANFFRTATVTPANPINYSSAGELSGMNTVQECTMFMEFEGYDAHTNMYYSLSSANRAFSSTEEQLGAATIVFTIIEDGLAVEFRDYDTPPFGTNWWSPNKFDADMFSFASLFVKQ